MPTATSRLKGTKLMKFLKYCIIILLPVFLISASGWNKTDQLTPSDEIRLFSDYVIDTSMVVHNNIRIAGGDLTVNGTVKGRITVYGGVIYINSTAVIDGEIIAVGGVVHEAPGAVINGKIIEANLKEGIVYREKESSPEIEGSSDFDIDEYSTWYRQSWVHPEVLPFTYNRNEGLLLSFPTTSWDRNGKSSLRLSVTAGWRFSHKTYAGRITLEQSLFRNKNIILFGSAFREAKTDDDWRLADWENSTASILAKQDFYDRWDESGYEYGVGVDLHWLKIKTSRVDLRQEEIPVHYSLWTLFQKDREFRPNTIEERYDKKLYRAILAFKPLEFDQFDSGFAFYMKGEQSVDSSYSRVMGLAKAQLRVYDDYVIRTRLMAGTSLGDLPEFRHFGIGGLGSVPAHAYKDQTGNQFVQLNLEIMLTPEFMDDDFTIILFADAGHAWDKSEYGFEDTDQIITNGIASAGFGIALSDDDVRPRFNFSLPLDGRDVWQTTIRLDFNF